MDGKRKDVSEFSNAFRTIQAWFSSVIFQYELITCLQLFEPWERYFINGVFLTAFVIISYSSCVYLPQFLRSLVVCAGEFLVSTYEYLVLM